MRATGLPGSILRNYLRQQDTGHLPRRYLMQPRLLFIYQKATTFVRDDLESLAAHFDIRSFSFETDSSTKVATLPTWLEHRKWLKTEIGQADIIFGWFADFHMVEPIRLAGKLEIPVVVALGGYDSANHPRLNYGVYNSFWRAPLARYVVRNATVLAPVAQALIRSENRFAIGSGGMAQGVAVHAKGMTTPYEVIPTGYDQNAWPPGPDVRKPSVCSVAIVDDRRTFLLKGLDLLLDAAARMPSVSFRIIGVGEALLPWLRATYSQSANVRIEPPRAREALAEVYQTASVYAQLSRSEGLPNVLCEAMLSGCIPVVSRVGGMPELACEVGEVVDEPNVDQVVGALEAALDRPSSDRNRARILVATAFSKEQRVQKLREVFNRLIQEHRK